MVRQTILGLCAATVALSLHGNAMADYTATINPNTTWGTWEGWGSSLAWWARAIGGTTNASTYADLIYTTNSVNGVPGLGLNVVRYNVGGGGINQSQEKKSPNMPWYKDIHAYWVDWNSSDITSTSWNWWVDSNQRNMMWMARDRGANQFELFSDSPVWWMNANHSTSGSDTAGADNLTSWNNTQFADYMAKVAKYAATNWGINFTSVEPFNEPAAGWWNYPNGQEGCNFSRSLQSTIIGNLRSSLNSQGLTGVAVAASDENSVDDAINTWNSFSSTTKNNVGRVNVHGYSGLNPYRGSGRSTLRSIVGTKKIWCTEYGDNDASGMTMADSITRDMYGLRPTAWCYWQPVEPDGGAYGWGLINATYADNGDGAVSGVTTPLVRVNRKFYVYGQFTRYLKAGYTIINIDDHNSVAAYNPTLHRLVIVTVNFGTGQWVNYNLSAFTTIGSTFTRVGTTTAPGGGVPDWLLMTDSWPVNNPSGKIFWSYFYPNTVQTFILDGVYK